MTWTFFIGLALCGLFLYLQWWIAFGFVLGFVSGASLVMFGVALIVGMFEK